MYNELSNIKINAMASIEKTKFIPPQPQMFLLWVTQRLSGLYAAWFCRFRLAIEPEDSKRLKKLQQSRVIFLPNHPTHADGIAMFVLSAQLHQWFYYIAAYESFKGLQGWLMSRLGAYSIRRGVGDRNSIMQTLELMQKPECKLVIFPEGGCSYQNDTVMPFREGAVGLALRALKKLAQNSDSVPDFYLVPVSLKYQHPMAMNNAIARSLKKLEKALGLEQKSPDFYWRLRAVAGELLQRLEAEFGIEVQPVDSNSTQTKANDWNHRIDRLKDTMLVFYEQQVELRSQPNLPMRERVYKVQAQLEKLYEKMAKTESNENSYDASDREPQNTIDEKLYDDTLRLLNLDAIYDGYIAENPTQERFLDTLTTLEREVFRVETPQPKNMRLAQVKIGELINLKDYLDDYCQDKDATVKKITQQVQQIVQTNVLSLSRDIHPSKLTF